MSDIINTNDFQSIKEPNTEIKQYNNLKHELFSEYQSFLITLREKNEIPQDTKFFLSIKGPDFTIVLSGARIRTSLMTVYPLPFILVRNSIIDMYTDFPNCFWLSDKVKTECGIK